ADVFATLKRAPESVKERIADIPGVELVETRVVANVVLDIPDFADPVRGTLISIDERGGSLLNSTYLRSGRMIDPQRADEVLVSEAFAEAHGFTPGAEIAAIINGRRQELTIVGVALSPEHIYMIAPGGVFPDFERYGVLWMNREPLANAYDMDEAFNDVTLTLSAGASREAVIELIDEIVKPYGGFGAIGRDDQISHRFLSEEFRQLRLMATVFPVIFLGVASFLLNVVISRVVRAQREQVATLKAFGYTNLALMWHFTKLITLIVILGVTVGLGVGVWLTQTMTTLYMNIYKFPYLRFVVSPSVVASAAAISLAAALLGAAYSVYRAVSQPPAEAMRPEAPAMYRETLVERLGLKRLLAQPTRMILRHIERQPVKSTMTILGISFSVAILMAGLFFADAVNVMIQVQFGFAQREDLAVMFVEPTSYRAYYELLNLDGVEYGEPFRAVPVDLKKGHRSFRTAIQGLEPDSDLVRLIDTSLRPVAIPAEGLVLTRYLADVLGVQAGDLINVEVLEGSRPVRDLPVTALVSEYIGVAAYMERSALNRLMREGDAISGVYLATDEARLDDIYLQLEQMPRVAGSVNASNAIESFFETAGNQLLTWALINTFLAGSIAIGVVYNSARIALAERSRELASLRVLGFRRAEVSYILLGEIAVLTLVAIPVGFVIGHGLCAYMVDAFQTDLFRIPIIISPRTYSYSAGVVLIASVVSGLIVRRRVDHLDLVAVLKTRE
ncbi:MAG: ABC transporter permease, partial [Acidobacteria bacterium]|nr:ABC transporter permease [Acidobacteriota bacterium]